MRHLFTNITIEVFDGFDRGSGLKPACLRGTGIGEEVEQTGKKRNGN
jgi:hypothetical protein